LRAGLGVEEFWSLTPRETRMAMEARAWRLEQETARTGELIRLAQKLAGWLAWHVAALQRSKRLPALQRLLGGGETKALTPEEARQRKAEFEELKRIAQEQRRNRKGRKEGKETADTRGSTRIRTNDGDGRRAGDSADSRESRPGQARRGPGGGQEEN